MDKEEIQKLWDNLSIDEKLKLANKIVPDHLYVLAQMEEEEKNMVLVNEFRKQHAHVRGFKIWSNTNA